MKTFFGQGRIARIRQVVEGQLQRINPVQTHFLLGFAQPFAQFLYVFCVEAFAQSL